MDPICHDWPNNVIHDITYHPATAYDLTHHLTTAYDIINHLWHHSDITKVHLQILTRMFWGTKDLLVIRVIYRKRRHTRPDNHQLPVTSPTCYDCDIIKDPSILSRRKIQWIPNSWIFPFAMVTGGHFPSMTTWKRPMTSSIYSMYIGWCQPIPVLFDYQVSLWTRPCTLRSSSGRKNSTCIDSIFPYFSIVHDCW